MKRIYRGSLVLLFLASFTGFSWASERHFMFSYESPVLQDGQKELETYTDYRFGRGQYYSALDQKLEFELGLGGGVQTSLYLNFTQEMLDDGTGNITNSFLADGISNEWKFKLMDNLTDDFGLGLYVENGFKPDEYELETKVILDKRMGDFLWTFNLTNEPEFHYIDNTMGFSVIPSLGLGTFLVPDRFFIGLEAQNLNFWYNTSLPTTTSILSAGPVLAYSAEDWWATLTYLPQLVNFQGQGLDFTNSQRNQIQLGFSIALNAHPQQNSVLLPTPTEQDTERLSKVSKTVSLKDLMKGKEFYANTCQRCHQIHAPSEFTDSGWEKILSKMQVKAKINDGTKESIFQYLMVFSKNVKNNSSQ
jgi:hypothetical protein